MIKITLIVFPSSFGTPPQVSLKKDFIDFSRKNKKYYHFLKNNNKMITIIKNNIEKRKKRKKGNEYNENVLLYNYIILTYFTFPFFKYVFHKSKIKYVFHITIFT